MNFNLLVALSLGDGFVEDKNKFTGESCLRIRHSNHQLDYINYKFNLNPNFWRYPPREYKNSFNNKVFYGHQIRSKFCKDLGKIRDLLYPNGKKTYTREILNFLDEAGLAIWFMDNGCIDNPLNKKPMGILNTYGNSSNGEEELIIKNYFKEKWNIDCSLNKNHNRYRLRFNNENFIKLVNLIKPFVIQSLQYKIDLRMRCNDPTKV
jgi:hypothetical protein